jgi:hypothetical protein
MSEDYGKILPGYDIRREVQAAPEQLDHSRELWGCAQALIINMTDYVIQPQRSSNSFLNWDTLRGTLLF